MEGGKERERGGIAVLGFLFFGFYSFWAPSLWDGTVIFRTELLHTADIFSRVLMLTLLRHALC